MKKLLDHDPLTGITQFFHYDELAGEMAIERVQPTDALIGLNRAEFNNAERTFGGESFVKVASIPLTLYMELRRKGVFRDPAALKRWLNDPDNRAFRTRPGVV